MITPDELINEYGLNAEAVDNGGLFEPQEEFNPGIIGISSDYNHVIYSYEKLAENLSESYRNQAIKNGSFDEDTDYYSEACEWLDVNTIPSLDYKDKEYVPIVVYGVIE